MSRPNHMTIVELVDRYPSLFYSQDWYRRDGGQSFMRILPSDVPDVPPSTLQRPGKMPSALHAPRWYAVDLLNCYVRFPTDPIWDRKIFTRDKDSEGHWIYVGCCANGHGLEIHRLLLPLTKDFGIPA